MSLLASTSFFWTGHQVGELAHDYVPALKQWASSQGIKTHMIAGMVCTITWQSLMVPKHIGN